MSGHIPPDALEGAVGGAARLLARKVGLRLDPAIRGRLARSVTEEAAARGLDARDYVEQLHTDPTTMQDLLDRVTVQETAFFRDATQFQALAEEVLPTLSPPVTVWSAGCANGQEPYSLAMTLCEAGIEGRVVATDISNRALTRTRSARYTTRELAGVSEERRAVHFRRVSDDWKVAAPLRARVEVVHHNLVAEPPPVIPGECQLLFCRNVLIYFHHDDVVALIEQMARWLAPDGWLFLGYAESLWQVTDRFQLVRVGDAFVYRQRAAARSSAPSLAGAPTRLRSATERTARLAPRAPGVPAAPAASRRKTEPAVATRTPQDADIVELLALGEAAFNSGDFPLAVIAFRKCTYLDPDEPIAHLHLGLALEASGDHNAARRAYQAARTALERSDTAAVEAVLEGYGTDELTRMLDDRISDR